MWGPTAKDLTKVSSTPKINDESCLRMCNNCGYYKKPNTFYFIVKTDHPHYSLGRCSVSELDAICAGDWLSAAEAEDHAALRAGTIIVAIIPVLMLYPLILKYYTRGVMEGGLKE